MCERFFLAYQHFAGFAAQLIGNLLYQHIFSNEQ
jgi:hypothetical protein